DDTRLVTTVDGTTPLGGDLLDVSADARYILFTSYSSAYVSDDTNQRIDLFVRDMEAGTVERVNVATDGSQEVGAETYYDDFEATMSADGRYVAFTTSGKLDPADKSDVDVYLRDRVAGTTTLVTHSTGLGGGDESFDPRISRDGRFVVFSSSIPNLVPHDDNFMPDVFEWDRVNDTFTCASTDSTGKFQKNIAYFYPHVSGDGGIVTFDELMLRGDQPRWIGTFIKDLGAGSLEKLPIESVVALSGDGRIVLFTSGTDRDPADDNGRGDGYVFDRQAGSYECVTFGTGKRPIA